MQVPSPKNVSTIAASPNPRNTRNTRWPMAKNSTHTPEPFGPRLARLRKAAGYTQAEFADAIGVSRRVVGYYEAESADTPSGSVLINIAKVLAVSVDQLLGLQRHSAADASSGRASKGKPHGNSRLMRKLKQLEQLPKAQQNAVLQHIDALALAYTRQHDKAQHR